MFWEMAFLFEFEFGFRYYTARTVLLYQRNCRRDTTLVSKSENLGCEKEEEDTYSLRHRKCGVRGFIQELFVSKNPNERGTTE